MPTLHLSSGKPFIRVVLLALACLGGAACSGNSRSVVLPTDAHSDVAPADGGAGKSGGGTGGAATGGAGTGGAGTGGAGTGGAGTGGAGTGGSGTGGSPTGGGGGGGSAGGGSAGTGVAGIGGLGGNTSGGGAGGAGGAQCPVLPMAVPSATTNVLAVTGVTVSTLAGSATSGNLDGDGSAASFNNPASVAIAPNGRLFVAAYDADEIRQVTPTGTVTTVVAPGMFMQPFGLVAATNDLLYIDTDKSPQLAKSGQSGTIWRVDVPTGVATVVKASLGRPRGVALLPDGRLVLADFYNNVLLVLDPATGIVTPLAGDPCPGFADGTGGAARFNTPYGLAVRADGAIVVADLGNHRLRLVRLNGTVETLAGDGTMGLIDGPVAQATFNAPKDVAIDAAGAIYVSDIGNHRIRRLLAGEVRTVAGDGVAGFRDGAGAQAEFFGQEGIDVTPDGRTVYVADGTNGESTIYNRLRAIAVPAP
jgi:sugar lactone lactonase YvrE